MSQAPGPEAQGEGANVAAASPSERGERASRAPAGVPFAQGSRAIAVVAPALEDLDIRHVIRPDPWPTKLLRRAITIPLLILFTTLWWAAAPVVVPILIVTDLIRRKPLLLTRFYLTIGAIVFGQTWGMFLVLGIWLVSGFGRSWRRANRWMVWAEGYWSDWNKRWMANIYDMSYVVEGSEVLRDGPTIMLTRHASINDTIMPIALITRPHRVRLRIVLKAELLYAPIVDIMGHIMPTAFVRRGSANPERELDVCRNLTRDLHPQETIMIFPEGTRFTPERRASILAKLQTKDPAAAKEAERLTQVLPLRLGGTHALIDAAPQADIVFCAHTGYENSATLADFVRGGLYRAVVRVKFWRVPAAQVPTDHAARATFLAAEWRKVDAFVAAHRVARN